MPEFNSGIFLWLFFSVGELITHRNAVANARGGCLHRPDSMLYKFEGNIINRTTKCRKKAIMSNTTDNFGIYYEEDFEEIYAPELDAIYPNNNYSELKLYIANVLIGNISAKRLYRSIGDKFTLYGFNAKQATFDENKTGKITTIFGVTEKNELCAYSTTSDRVYTACKIIASVYGDELARNGVPVVICEKKNEKSISYTLEVVKGA